MGKSAITGIQSPNQNDDDVKSNCMVVGEMEAAGPRESEQEFQVLFLRDWYLKENPDVAAAGVDAFAHFMEHGVAEGRNPSPYFDVSWYLDRYADVRDQGVNPVLHYLRHGAAEGRNPNAYFDTEWYAASHAEEMVSGCNPLVHFVEIGEARGDRPSKRFDPKLYRRLNPEIESTDLSPFAHFLKYGQSEGRAFVRDDNHFAYASDLADFISSVAPSTNGTPASVEMDVSSVEAAMAGAIVQGAQASLQRFKASGEGLGTSVPAFPGAPYVARLNNVRLIAGTRYLVCDHDLILHDEEAALGHRDDAALKHQRAKRLENGQLLLQFDVRQAAWIESGINAMHEYSNNYFHFVAETLPRLVLAEEAGIAENVPVLYEANLHRTMVDLLKSVCPPSRPLLPLEPGTIYSVDTLYQLSDLSSVIDAYEGGELATQAVLDVERIRKAIAKCKPHFIGESSQRRRKIYAGRSSKNRHLLNQQRLESALVQLGFEILRCEDLDLETQIRIFSEAEIVIAPTGAQVTNIVWCPPGTRWIVLASDHPHHQLYLWELLGRVSGAAVEYSQGLRAFTRDDRYSVHDDYTVDIDKILSAI